MKRWSIRCDAAVTPDTVLSNPALEIENNSIASVKKNAGAAPATVRLDGCVISPGFINSHDHLLGNYYPKVGDRRPYINWLPWDCDLKSSPIYRERQQVDNRDLYLLAGYRNLVSGVTSVQDHIPHFVQDPYLKKLPLKVISRFAMAHSISSFALNWGDGIDVEYKKAIHDDIPFVTHIAEGFDEETIRDVQTLDKRGGLGDHSVLIHGIAFSKSDMQLIKQRKASMVWCCDSNLYMFEKTADIKSILEVGINACIGTDSPMSGGENMLTEIKICRDYYKSHYGSVLPDKQIIKMITENPAKAFRLYENGRIETGMMADLVAVTMKKDQDPYDALVSATLEDIRLVVINGLPVYGYASDLDLYKNFDLKYQIVKLAGIDRFIIGDLKGVLGRINKAVGFDKKFPFMPVEL